jgi:hypothetical protein
MKFLSLKCLLLFFIFCVSVQAETANQDLDISKLSDNKYFQISYSSKLQPIQINNLHAWILHIKDANGENVPNAEIKVVGGMPEHNHGLPTQPQITENLGDGCYLLEGMKFHMHGWWTVTISITDEDITDNVTFNLQL